MYIFGGVVSIGHNTRTENCYRIWLRLPSLQTLCWQKLISAYPQLLKIPQHKLRQIGVSRDLIDKLSCPEGAWLVVFTRLRMCLCNKSMTSAHNIMCTVLHLSVLWFYELLHVKVSMTSVYCNSSGVYVCSRDLYWTFIQIVRSCAGQFWPEGVLVRCKYRLTAGKKPVIKFWQSKQPVSWGLDSPLKKFRGNCPFIRINLVLWLLSLWYLNCLPHICQITAYWSGH